MTEQEWLASNDPAAMLEHLHREGYAASLMGHRHGPGAVSERKLRLWVEALRQCYAIKYKRDHAAAGWGRNLETESGLLGAVQDWSRESGGTPPTPARVTLLHDICGNPFRPFGGWPYPRFIDGQLHSLGQAAYDERLPDGFLDPARLAILADALEDAGCTEQAADDCKACGGLGWMGRISLSGRKEPTWPCPACKGGLLAHLRSPGPHARGCWALDLVLGKS